MQFGLTEPRNFLSLIGFRRSNVLKQAPLYGPKLLKIALHLAQTQVAIGSASNFFGIVLILTIILPETHGANFVMATTEESLKLAARTTICLMLFNRFVDVFKHITMRVRASGLRPLNLPIYQIPSTRHQLPRPDRCLDYGIH